MSTVAATHSIAPQRGIQEATPMSIPACLPGPAAAVS